MLLQDRALRQAAAEARILPTAALAIRGCTAETIVPKLARPPEGEFHEATVPSFAAQAAFRAVARAYRAHTDREPALNPTALLATAAPRGPWAARLQAAAGRRRSIRNAA